MADQPLPLNFSTLFSTRKSMVFAHGFVFTFVSFLLFILLSPSSYYSSSSSPSPAWFSRNINEFKNPNARHIASILSHILPNSTSLSSISNRTQIGNSPQILASESNRNGNRHDSKSKLYESMVHCDLFDGRWVRDDSYPLYEHGSCPYVDEGFNCFLNGRPDNDYERFRWQPNHCSLPRLNNSHMLDLLRGKRVVYLGDSLNRNMWESLVCILRNSMQDKNKVFEASGRQEFRSAGGYTFIFEDYNLSVEYFRAPFLVQELEVPGKNGSNKRRMRLDLVERSFDKYKDADILIFNTGHWWTRGRTSGGKNYYQEGSNVYHKLHIMEAYTRALKTWANWVDSNVNPQKTQVFFRGYSITHFRGGKWNSGGKCDKETEPFKNETYLLSYPPKVQILENVMKGMKTPVVYLNISRLTDYRKDAHPAIYRAKHLSDEERHSPLRYQDCSHWCLPGVPDTWNELIYAQMLLKHYQQKQQEPNGVGN